MSKCRLGSFLNNRIRKISVLLVHSLGCSQEQSLGRALFLMWKLDRDMGCDDGY